MAARLQRLQEQFDLAATQIVDVQIVAGENVALPIGHFTIKHRDPNASTMSGRTVTWVAVLSPLPPSDHCTVCNDFFGVGSDFPLDTTMAKQHSQGSGRCYAEGIDGNCLSAVRRANPSYLSRLPR